MLKQVMRYLKRTDNYAILLPNQNHGVHILCWTDADCSRDLWNRNSGTGSLVTLTGGAVICTSKFHTSTAICTSEAVFNVFSYSVKK